MVIAWRNPGQFDLILATIVLCLLLGWVITHIPDDLNLSTLKIYNMQGKLCYQIHQPQNFEGIINVENWANGIYLLSIEGIDDSVQIVKFSIEK